MVTAKLICVFVFAYAKSRFSYDTSHIAIINQALYFSVCLGIFEIHEGKFWVNISKIFEDIEQVMTKIPLLVEEKKV